MLLIVLAIFLSISAVTVLITAGGNGVSKRLNRRVATLGEISVPAFQPETATDIRREQQKLSAIPWLNHWLTRMNLASASSLYLSQAGVTVTLGTLLTISVAGSALLGAIVYLRFGQTGAALLAAAAFPALPFCYVRQKRSTRMFRLEQQLPDALGMVAGALRAGHSLVASLGAVTQEASEPIRGELRKCFEEQNFGVDFRAALANLTVRVPLQDYRMLVAAIMIQRESGGNLAEVLEKLAQTTRERFRLNKQVRIHTAQGRMTGWILSLFPLVLGTALYLMNPKGMSVLWTTDIGLTILYTAAVMDLIGGMIIRKIVNIRV